MKPIYIAMGEHVWGTGDNADSALEAMRKVGPSKRYIVFRAPTGSSEAWVDNMGGINWKWSEGADKSGKLEIVMSRPKGAKHESV